MHCQRCRLEITPHKSLNLTEQQAQLFQQDTATNSPIEPIQNESDSTILTETFNPLNRTDQPPRSPHSTSITKETESIERLLCYVSGHSDLDLPLCQGCADQVKHGLKIEYQECCRERDAYITLLNKVKDEPVAGSVEVDDLVKEISDLEQEVEGALIELVKAEKKLEVANEELKKVKSDQKESDIKHSEIFSDRNFQEHQIMHQLVETRRLEALSEYQESQLRRLQATNVYNDVFSIGNEGKFGTINGLRLGRLNDEKVEWSEINAAWGQVLLMLSCLIAKLGIKITDYRLRPLGSMSRIDKLELNPDTGDVMKSTSLDLYSSDYSFERFLHPKRMDAAMAAFLDILNIVGGYVEATDTSLRLPYAIDGDKIGNLKLSLSSNEGWTAACRYVLTNLKWIMAYATSH